MAEKKQTNNSKKNEIFEEKEQKQNSRKPLNSQGKTRKGAKVEVDKKDEK